MTSIQILTPLNGPANSAALQFPFFAWKRDLLARDLDIELRVRNVSAENVTEADIIAIDSRCFSTSYGFAHPIAQEGWLNTLRQKADKLIWFDTSDSSGTIDKAALSKCDMYLKQQTLKDRTLYARPLYGMRLHSDYYHRHFGINDEQPTFSEPIPLEEAEKIGIFWNSFAQNFGPWARHIRKLRRVCPLPSLHRFSRFERPAASERPQNIFARMSSNYARATISFQRNLVLSRIEAPYNRLSHKEYMKEMASSRAVLSPFGWGEINLRDFECFMMGGALVKPSMQHLETWPNFWLDENTYISHKWDFSDFNEVIDRICEDKHFASEIALNGQELWRDFTIYKDAKTKFIDRIDALFKAVK